MADEFEILVNETALKIKEVLAMSARGRKFPTYKLHVVDETITDKEEELGMCDVPLDEKFHHTLEEVPGIILDAIDIEQHVGDYPGAWGTPTPQSSYPYVTLNPNGCITRRVGSRFPDREGYFPCDSPNCRSENSFPIDYLVYAGRALETIQNLPSVSDAVQKMFYVVFVDNHAGGYGYWLGTSEKELRDMLKGEGYDDVKYGSFSLDKKDRAIQLLDEATRVATEPFHSTLGRGLQKLESCLSSQSMTGGV